MRNILLFSCVLVALVLVDGGASEKTPTEKPILKVSFGSQQKRHSDNVASASTVSAKTIVKANDSPAAAAAKTKATSRDESLVTAESQSQHQFVPIEDPRSQQQQSQQQQQHQVISESEYLALIQGSQAAAAEENGPAQHQAHHLQHQHQQPQYHKLPSAANQIANTYYTKGHPLAGSSLEKEIEKLVSSNTHQYGHHPQTIALEQQNHIEPEAPAQPQAHHEVHGSGAGVPPQQPRPIHHYPQQSSVAPQQYRSPVVYKNGNDIVYIPYQQQLLHRDQYPIPRPVPAITKAKIQYISANPAVRAPIPSEAIEYGPATGSAHPPPPQYTPIKTSESFKELYLQQQQQNHLKRLQAQQISRDNLNLHTHAQPQAIVYTSTSNSPAPSQAQPQAQAYQAPQQQHQHQIASSGHSNIAQLADRLFKTPLDQQKPLSQAEFKALVAAGYPVQAVPVHTVVGATKTSESVPRAHFPQRYSPSSAPIPNPQPFSKEPQTPQLTSSRAPVPQSVAHQPSQLVHSHPHHQQSPHRLYLQRHQVQSQPLAISPAHHHHVSAAGQSQYAEGKGQQYTYVVQPGENEESAAEKLRQRIIQEINSQTHNGVANSAQVPPQIVAGYAPGQIEYQKAQQAQRENPGQGHQQHQHQQQQEQQQQTEEAQKPYYKRLDYY